LSDWYTPEADADQGALYRRPALLPTVRVETAFPRGLALEQAGIRSETEFPVALNNGEFERTQTGDFVRYTEQVSTPTGTTYEDVTRMDVGAGPAALQDVAGGAVGYVRGGATFETQATFDPRLPAETHAYAPPADESGYEQLPATSFDVALDADGGIIVQDATGADISIAPPEEV